MTQQWFEYVETMYKHILEESEKFDSGIVIVDIDETVLYNTNCEIPTSTDFINKLSKKFDIYFVTERIHTIARRKETIKDLKNYTYKGLILRPAHASYTEFKQKIKTKLNPIFTISDQAIDSPDYLIKNPFYYVNANGDEIYYKID